jgi:hypothetical protein
LERTKKSIVEEMVEDSNKRNEGINRPLVVLMDGALALWALISNVLCGVNFTGILDIIHVVEYLWLAGNALHGENTKEGKEWVYRQLLLILQGNVGEVIGALRMILKTGGLKKSKVDVLNRVIKYFENHREWMKYDEYLKRGYPIGTGIVESTCGHTVKSRMEGTGRRWSIVGAESVLLLRSIYTSGDWDAYRCARIRFERGRLYGAVLRSLGICDDYNLHFARNKIYFDN